MKQDRIRITVMLGLVALLTVLAACTREVVKEVPVEGWWTLSKW